MRKTMACAAILITVAGAAAAQDWPSRPLTLIVPFAAGGGVDVSARIQAQHMGELLGASIIVENIGAAAGMAGGQRVARAPPMDTPSSSGTREPTRIIRRFTSGLSTTRHVILRRSG